MMAPILDELSSEMEGKVKIGKINTEIPDHQQLAVKYQIQSIPNMKLFKDGKVVKEFIGLRAKEIFQNELEQSL